MPSYNADVFHFDLRLEDDIPPGSWDEFLAISTSTVSTPPPVSTLAGRLAQWVNGLNIDQLLVVRQKDASTPWHWHITVRLTRTYKSTYKWWKKELDELGLTAPALEAGPHDDWQYRVGYSQEDTIEILKQHRISDEYMLQAKQYYQLMKQRHQLRSFKRKLEAITPTMLDAMVEAAEVEFGTNRNGALTKLALAGFAFPGSGIYGAWAQRYKNGLATGAPANTT